MSCCFGFKFILKQTALVSFNYSRSCCHNTDYVHVNEHDKTIIVILAKYGLKITDDGSFVIRNILEHFYIFYNFNYI